MFYRNFVTLDPMRSLCSIPSCFKSGVGRRMVTEMSFYHHSDAVSMPITISFSPQCRGAKYMAIIGKNTNNATIGVQLMKILHMRSELGS